MGNGDFKKAIFKNMFGVIMYENLKAEFLSYNRTNRKLTNSEVALFADWVSTEIFRDQLNNLDDYNFWKKCKKIVGDDETLVSYFNSCKFVLDNSMLFLVQFKYISIEDYCIDVLEFINEEFGLQPLYFRYPTYETIAKIYMSKGRMADALRFSYRGVEIIKNCKKVSGVDDPFDELKFLGQEDLTMLESLYKRIFSVYNLLSESHDGKFIEDAFHALGKLLNELKLRGKSIKLYNDLKALLIQRLRYEKNYTDDEIGKILLTGKC